MLPKHVLTLSLLLASSSLAIPFHNHPQVPLNVGPIEYEDAVWKQTKVEDDYKQGLDAGRIRDVLRYEDSI